MSGSFLGFIGDIVNVMGEKGDKISQSARGPLAAGAQVGGMAAGEMTKAARAWRKQLWDDVGKMERGELGMAESVKQQAAQNAQNAGLIQAQQQQAALQQQAAQAGTAGRSGSYFEAQNAINAAAQNARAQGMAAADTASQQYATSQQQDIKARLGQQYDRGKALWGAVGGAVAKGIMSGSGGEVSEEDALNAQFDDLEKETPPPEYGTETDPNKKIIK